MGATIAPNIIPNLNQSRFNGLKSFDSIIPKIKKMKANKISQILISSPFVIGQRPKIKNIMKKTKPKFRFEFIFILDLCNIINYFYK